MTCVIMHGHAVCLYVGNETLGCGSSWQWECIMRSLQKVFIRLRSRAQQFPRECLGLRFDPETC